MSYAQTDRAPFSHVGLAGLRRVDRRRALENRLQKWRGRRGRACPVLSSAGLGAVVSWLELNHAASQQLRDFLKGGNWVTCIVNPPA